MAWSADVCVPLLCFPVLQRVTQSWRSPSCLQSWRQQWQQHQRCERRVYRQVWHV